VSLSLIVAYRNWARSAMQPSENFLLQGPHPSRFLPVIVVGLTALDFGVLSRVYLNRDVRARVWRIPEHLRPWRDIFEPLETVQSIRAIGAGIAISGAVLGGHALL
jgi:hypothetical protein